MEAEARAERAGSPPPPPLPLLPLLLLLAPMAAVLARNSPHALDPASSEPVL